MKIYFAASIRGGRDDRALYLDIAERLRPYGEVLTEHVADESLTSAGEALDDRGIHDRDLAWLRESNFLVAEVTTPSLGVGYEIALASQWGTPTLALFRPSSGRSLSAMVRGCTNVVVHEYRVAEELDEVFSRFFFGIDRRSRRDEPA